MTNYLRFLFFTLILCGFLQNLAIASALNLSPDLSKAKQNNDQIEPATDEAFYNGTVQQLEQSTKGCKKSRKTIGNMTYEICTINGQPVQASEALTQEGDGLGYWFKNRQVRAIRFFHNGDLAIFNDGKLAALFYDGDKMKTDFTASERKELEATARTGYRQIFQVFKIR
ncbi:hypothetical protein NIES2119_03345 [[Phormidium ambiguum] IAM M-71]|uniref:Uncharacterized protein n=1 Tax=[Phormidium ambiguum] IAM M-71 TaxID=454136 RepID=A0A1U7IRG9_9CYAN|nr:hypothetical protein [Phormidium ambiguum]OKH39996.1 hypothetical protein NIES2119_03345 [Phormidium ambiguum IAM M-71]